MSAGPTRRGRATGRGDSGLAPWRVDVATWRRVLNGVLWFATVGAALYGLTWLEPHAAAVARQSACQLVWQDLPAWLADPGQRELLAQIEQSAGLRSDDDLFDPQLCARVAASLLGTPWVAGVERVSKSASGAIRVRATFREPLTLVDSSGMAYLIDQTGVRLPYQIQTDMTRPRDWLIITGAEQPVPDVGQTWPGDDLEAGIKLVQYLQTAQRDGVLPIREHLRGVDVANYRGRRAPRSGWLQIRTIDPGLAIHWGHAPGEEYGMECSAERKLAALADVYAKYGGQLPRATAIDIRDKDRYLVEPR